MLQLSFITLLAIGLLVPQVHAGSQLNDQQNRAPRNALAGAWIGTITSVSPGPGPTPGFKGITVYNEDGTAVSSDQGGVNLNDGLVFSAGAGAWIHLRDRTFAWTFLTLISDTAGNLIGSVKVRGESTVDESGNNHTLKWVGEGFDANGNLIFANSGTGEAQRIVVERLQ
jgi:hypothetical protein